MKLSFEFTGGQVSRPWGHYVGEASIGSRGGGWRVAKAEGEDRAGGEVSLARLGRGPGRKS